MNHFMFDAYKGYRSRLDDIHLINEFLEEIPFKIGIKAVMPPFVLPYYNGVVPDDCGISAFVFLEGGHFTIHTFSFREVLFIDLLYPKSIDTELLINLIKSAFPAEKISHNYIERNLRGCCLPIMNVDIENDFGPHLLLDIENFQNPTNLDDLFDLFDELPSKIGMTPIMRPYIIKNKYGIQKSISILTMIAESHISLHFFVEPKKAYFDLFSCSFFSYEDVIKELRDIFTGEKMSEICISRGSKYRKLMNDSNKQLNQSRNWINNSFSFNSK